MSVKIKVFYYFIIFSYQLSATNKIQTPIFFYQNSYNGSDWVYEKKNISIFGAGLKGSFSNTNWDVNATYIQFGFLGNIKNGLFNFAPSQSFPYIDGSKDADGYWSEYLNAKITYTKDSIILEFENLIATGDLEREFIYSLSSSYPQFGMNWK